MERHSSQNPKKWRYFRLGEYRYSEVDEAELRVFLAAYKPRCDLCGKYVECIEARRR